jgi:hypothetical protein
VRNCGPSPHSLTSITDITQPFHFHTLTCALIHSSWRSCQR